MALGSALKAVFTRFNFDFDGAKLAAMNRTTGKAVGNLSLAAKQAALVKQQTMGLMGGLRTMFGVLAGGVAVKALTVDFARQADEIGRMSKALGVTTEFFTSFRFALESVGIQGDETAQLIADISERMFDAATGSKALADDFGQIGFTRAQLKELSEAGPEKQILALADAMQKAGPGAKRTFSAMSGLGDVGARMLPLLERGSEGLKAMMLEAKKLGVTLDESAIKEARVFNAQMIRMKARVTVLRNKIALALIPTVSAVISRFVKWTKEGKNAEVMLTTLGVVAGIATVIIAKMVTVFIIAQWAKFVAIIKSAVTWFKLLNKEMLFAAAKVVALVAAVALLALIIEDLVYFARGDKSLTEEILGRDEDVLEGLLAIRDTFREITDVLLPAFRELWQSIVMLGAAFGIRLTTVTDLLKRVGKILFKVVLMALIWIGRALAFIVKMFAAIIFVVAKLATAIVDTLITVVRELGEAFRDMGDAAVRIFEWIRNSAGAVAVSIENFFVGAARVATKAWRKFADFLDTVKTKAVSLAGKLKRFIFRETEGVTSGLAPPGQTPPRPAGVKATTNVNVGGITVNAPAGVGPEDIAKAVDRRFQKKINGAVRDIKPITGTGIPVSVGVL